MSPYEITFGKKPPSIPLCLIGDSNVAAVDEWLTKCDALFSILTKKLSKAQQRMKANADNHQRDVQFEVRDQAKVITHGGSIIQLKGDTSQHLEAMSPPQL